MQPDFDKYRRHLDALDLPEPTKRDVVHSLWRTLESFVDRAFGTDCVQHLRSEPAPEDAKAPPLMLDYDRASQPTDALSPMTPNPDKEAKP